MLPIEGAGTRAQEQPRPAAVRSAVEPFQRIRSHSALPILGLQQASGSPKTHSGSPQLLAQRLCHGFGRLGPGEVLLSGDEAAVTYGKPPPQSRCTLVGAPEKAGGPEAAKTCWGELECPTTGLIDETHRMDTQNMSPRSR